MQNADSFVRWFRQVAPYVHDFGGRTFVIAFGGEMVAERARFASFIHDLNLLAALEIRLVLVYGARPQIEAELKAKGLKSHYAQGLRVTDEQALDGGQACRRHAARGDRGAAFARAAELADGPRTDPRRLRKLHHRTADRRAQGRRLPVHRRGAQGRRRRAIGAPRRRRHRARAASSATRRPARCSTSRGRTSPRTWPWPCTPTSCSCTPTSCPPTAKGKWCLSSPPTRPWRSAARKATSRPAR